MAIKHRTYRTLANAKTWDGAVLSGGETIRLVDSAGIKTYVLISVSTETPDDYLYFAPTSNPGTKMWHLVPLHGAMSHVQAVTTAGQSIPHDTSTLIVFGTKNKDTLGEYDHTTGIFTATYADYYDINSCVLFTSVAWETGELAYLDAYVNDVVIYRGDKWIAQVNHSAQVTVRFNGTVYVPAGETIKMRAYQNQDGAVGLVTNAIANYLTIDRKV